MKIAVPQGMLTYVTGMMYNVAVVMLSIHAVTRSQVHATGATALAEEQSGQDAGHQNAFGPQTGSEKHVFRVAPPVPSPICG